MTTEQLDQMAESKYPIPEKLYRGAFYTEDETIEKERAAYIEGIKLREGWRPINTAPFDVKVVVGHPSYDTFPVAQLMMVDGEDEGGNSGSWYMWVSEDEDQWEDGTLWPDLGYIEPTHWMPLPALSNQSTPGAKEGV